MYPKYPAAPPRIRPTTVRPIMAPVPLMTTAPIRKQKKNTPEPRSTPSTKGINLEPAKAKASPTTIEIMPMNFLSPKITPKLRPHPASWSVSYV